MKTYPIFSSRLFSLDVSFSIIYRIVSEFVQDEDFKRDTCSFVVLILVPYRYSLLLKHRVKLVKGQPAAAKIKMNVALFCFMSVE